MGEFATRDSLFGSASKITTATLRTGEVVGVSEMSVGDRTAIDFACAKQEGEESNPGRAKFREMLIVACACDAKGNRLFTANDVERVRAAPAGLFEPIVDKAMEINGYSESDVADLEGN